MSKRFLLVLFLQLVTAVANLVLLNGQILHGSGMQKIIWAAALIISICSLLLVMKYLFGQKNPLKYRLILSFSLILSWLTPVLFDLALPTFNDELNYCQAEINQDWQTTGQFSAEFVNCQESMSWLDKIVSRYVGRGY